MSAEIRLEQTYPFPPQRVWWALTDRDAMERWLMPNDFEPRIGHKFRFTGKPMPGWRGFVECEVLELEEPRLLAYTWMGDDDWTAPTVVRWRLAPTEEGTLLTLEHTGFEEPWGPSVADMLGQGWGKMMQKRLLEVLRQA
jgi:uncharacterized protein YndB with AHSA1/START domain